MYQWKQELHITGIKLTTSPQLCLQLWQRYLQFGVTMADGFLQCVCAQLWHKVVQCLSFQFLSGYSLMSDWGENLLHSRRL